MMQLVGIGFSREHWGNLIQRLQKSISFQMNEVLLGESHSHDEPRIWPAISEQHTEKILKAKPDWLFFLPGAFESANAYVELLKQIQQRSQQTVRPVMVIDRIENDLIPLIETKPELELVNKMEFTLTDADLLLMHHIHSFPRIRLGDDVQTLEYMDASGNIVRRSKQDIKVNTLIPLKNIKRIATVENAFTPDKWLHHFLSQRPKPVQPEQVVGILKEEKGCYLFPGIPFNSIKKIVFDSTCIEHLIQLNDCNLKSPPFKKLVKGLQSQEKSILSKIDQTGTDLQSICILSDRPFLVQLTQNLLEEQGHANIACLHEFSQGIQILDDSALWLRLQDFPGVRFKGEHINWTEEVNQFLSQVENFVDVEKLQPPEVADSIPLPRMELEKRSDEFLLHERRLEDTIHQAQNTQLLHNQERGILKNIEPFSRLLMAAISTSQNWESIYKEGTSLNQSRALLLCEDEDDAAEMNSMLTGVPLKLWLNPMVYKDPEELLKLDTDTIRAYFQPGCLILSVSAKKHLEELCQLSFQKSRESEAVYKEQKTIIQSAKKELSLLKKKKQKLALRWINVSLKQYFLRDHHLFQMTRNNSPS